MSLSAIKKFSRSEWIRKHGGSVSCPKHIKGKRNPHDYPTHWMTRSMWCPTCRYFWRLQRNMNTLQYSWYSISRVINSEHQLNRFNEGNGMGYYIQSSEPRGKAEEIARLHNGQVVSFPKAKVAMGDKEKGVIVVVHNHFFEAAGFAYDMDEFDAFTRMDDHRVKEFVIISRADAEKLSGYTRSNADIR